jgi:Stress responsive A/B Barrel Domain
MIVHLVLFRPRASLSSSEQKALVASIEQAAATIPSVRRFRVGRALPDPPAYLLQGFPDLPYVAMLEFEDRDALENYLEHQMHGELGRRFNDGAEAALIYDYEVHDAAEASRLL